jgi:hypothetical protein
LRRDLFVSDVGPEANGSKPGKEGCHHMPEKSGICVPLPDVWPRPGVAAAAETTVNTKTDCHHCMRVPVICPRPLASEPQAFYAKAVNAHSQGAGAGRREAGKNGGIIKSNLG